MGRNERLSDSKTLIDADKAYVESGGSWDAVIVSLLTSDSFIYRKASDSKEVARGGSTRGLQNATYAVSDEVNQVAPRSMSVATRND